MTTERLLSQLAALESEATVEPAPARLKSRIYSTLVSRQAEEGPLRPLSACMDAGGHLCIFERSVAILQSDRVGAKNPCNVCHARIMAERFTWAPIFWPGCPYSEFHNP